MLLACSLTILASIQESATPPPAPAARIDQLIAKVREYEGFEAVYRCYFKDGSGSQTRLLYRSPDRFRVQMDSAAERADFLCRGDDLQVRMRDMDGASTHASTRIWGWFGRFNEQLRLKLRSEFGDTFRSADLPAPVKSSFHCQIQPGSTASEVSMDLGMRWGGTGGGPLDWLEEARLHPEFLAQDDGAARELSFTPFALGRMWISTENGFVTRVEKLTGPNRTMILELARLDLSVRPAEAEFDVTPVAAGSRDMTADWERMAAGIAQQSALGTLHQGLAHMLDDRHLEWNEALRGRLEVLLRWQHEEVFPVLFNALVAKRESSIGVAAAAFREELGKLPARDQSARNRLVQEVASMRSDLVHSLGGTFIPVTQQPELKVACERRPSLLADFSALDEPIQRAVFSERIEKPLLAKFDALVASQLEPVAPRQQAESLATLEGLIAKVNTYAGFVAVYRVHSREDGEGSLRLQYTAPDRFRTRLDSGSVRFDTYLRGYEFATRGWTRDRLSTATNESLRESFEVGRLRLERLRATFGALLGAALPFQYGRAFAIAAKADPADVLAGVGANQFGSSLFTWLDEAHQHAQAGALEVNREAELGFSSVPGARTFFSLENGLVTRIEKDDGPGVRVVLELESLDLEARPAEAEFEAPPVEMGTRDLSLNYEHARASALFDSGREMLAGTLARILDSGRADWSPELERKAAEMLRKDHEEDLAQVSSGFVDSSRSLIEQKAEWLTAALSHLEPSDATGRGSLVQRMAAVRTELERMLDENLADLIARPWPPVPCDRRPWLQNDLVALEKPILAGLHAELIRKLLLAAFDEKVAKQLDAK